MLQFCSNKTLKELKEGNLGGFGRRNVVPITLLNPIWILPFDDSVRD